MKKIFLSVIACAGLLTACDMNTTQYGVIDDTAELSFDYITQNRNYSVYSALRGCTVGSWVYDTELQLDQFIALSTNGGRGMNIADGSINPSNGSATGTFEGMYSRIAQVNFMIEKAQNALDQGNPTADEAAELSRYVAEGKFARAYFYFYLFDHFCQTYDSAKGDTEGLGLQLVTVYNPDGDTSKYPGRSSMNATLELINGDLLDAFNGLQAYEKAGNTSYTVAGSNYLSSYAAAALQARVALVTGKYADAIAKANYVIGGKYSLATGDDYVDMWYDENVDELIFTPFVNKDEISSPTSFSIAQGWNYWWPGKTDQCDYIPTQESVLSLAEFEDAEGYINDVRFESFVANIPIAVEGGTVRGYAFVKYPGNPSLNSSNTNYYMNTPKPFRLSEQYLIKAEAAALNDDPNTANSAISDLVKARLYDTDGFTPINLNGSALLTFIRNERSKELMGEGFRLSDLRRWKQGFDRNQPYVLNSAIADTRSVVALSVRYDDEDHRFVWPIPASEIEINPQIAKQQNPGY